jgi:hypothetical protein
MIFYLENSSSLSTEMSVSSTTLKGTTAQKAIIFKAAAGRKEILCVHFNHSDTTRVRS